MKERATVAQTEGTVGNQVQDSVPDPGDSEEHALALAARIATRFKIPRPLEAYDFPDKGNINLLTFLITGGTPGNTGEFLLQQINQQVFTRPRSVMAAMVASLEAQQRNLANGLVPEGRTWEAIRLIDTRGGAPYLEHTDRRGTSCWRLMVKTVSYTHLTLPTN